MGASIAKLFSYFWASEEARILVRLSSRLVYHSCPRSISSRAFARLCRCPAGSLLSAQFIGLDAAGKTTLLYKLKLGEVLTTIPTIGFNVETIEYKGLKMTSWDVGGRVRLLACNLLKLN